MMNWEIIKALTENPIKNQIITYIKVLNVIEPDKEKACKIIENEIMVLSKYNLLSFEDVVEISKL